MSRKAVLGIVLVVVGIIGAFALLSPHKPVAVKHPPNDDPWLLVSYSPDDPTGTYLGNGFISTRIMGDGVGSQDGKPLPCYMAGLYDNEKLIPIPTWSDLRFYDGKKRFVIDKEAPYKQVLNMKTGILTTYATWRAGDKTLKGRIEVIVSRAVRSTALVRATLTPLFNGIIHCEYVAPRQTSPLELYSSGLVDYWEPFAADTTTAVFEDANSRLRLSMVQTLEPGQGSGARVRRGRRFDVCSWTSIYAPSKNGENPPLGEHENAMNHPNAFIAAHKAAMARFWQHDIIIDGPRKDQQAIHSCMFYLMQSVREGSQWSIPPMGLSNNAFNGHVFWDADTWMFPALILQHPELARSIVDYRYNTLSGAMANARKSGYQGAEYAWESGASGKEDIQPGLVYQRERHINGDVALAQWQYFLATGDLNWLKTRGYPVIKATADYWASRAKLNQGRYQILQVVPPDENAELVNNSAYTNVIAQINLEIASKAAGLIGASANPKWAEMAKKMYIPYDAKNRRLLAFDGYKGLQAKQADTELTIYPLQYGGFEQSPLLARNTFDFYSRKVMPNGPAMTSSAHAVIAARFGDCARAYRDFKESYTPFLRGPFNYFNEKRSRTWDNMCFLTGAAGPIQATLFGLAGAYMDYTTPGADLVFRPCLPKQWKSLKVTGVQWRGKTLDVTVSQGNKVKVEPRG